MSRKGLRHLGDAVARLENSGQGSVRQAQKGLHEAAVEEVLLHLDLTAQCYVAAVQFGLAWIAFDYHEGKPDVARTRSEQVTQSLSGLRAGIEDVHGRIGRLEEHVRSRFRSPKRIRLLSSVASAIAAATAAVVQQTTGKRVPVGQLRGIPVSLPVAPFAIGAGALLVGGLDAVTQLRAEKELEERLAQLSGATGRSCQSVREAAPNLGMLHSLAEGLAEPAT